jgi:hypothetical protein
MTTNNIDIMMFLHEVKNGRVVFGKDKIPTNAFELNIGDVVIRNIHDAHGRHMFTMNRRLAEQHGIVQPPRPVVEAVAARTTQPPLVRHVESNTKSSPESEHEVELENALVAQIESAVVAETVDMAKKLAPRNGGGLLAKAGVSSRNS